MVRVSQNARPGGRRPDLGGCADLRSGGGVVLGRADGAGDLGGVVIARGAQRVEGLGEGAEAVVEADHGGDVGVGAPPADVGRVVRRPLGHLAKVEAAAQLHVGQHRAGGEDGPRCG